MYAYIILFARLSYVVTVAAFEISSILDDGTENEVKVAVVACEDSNTERGLTEKELLEWVG